MKRLVRFGSLAAVLLSIGISVFAQKPAKAPAYKIAMIQVNAFNEAKGDLSDPLDKKNPTVFFNDLSTSLFVWVVIQGEKGSFEPGRMISMTAMEGKKLKTSRTVQIGLIGEEGFYFVPLYVYGPLCSRVTISATITGQKVGSSQKVSVPFQCGE